MVGAGGAALSDVYEQRNRVRIPPSSTEISLMERALGWQVPTCAPRPSWCARSTFAHSLSPAVST
jgi:hypothetical protein